MDEDRFLAWIRLKMRLNHVNRMPDINEGEIWWAAVGKNVGVEINGKNEQFSRPVLIYRKLSREGFMGIPLTSQRHAGTWYFRISLRDKASIAVLAQARTMSVSRLYSKMGEIPRAEMEVLRRKFVALYG